MRKLYLTALILSIGIAGTSQLVNKPKRKVCYTTTYLNKLQKKNPKIESTTHFESWLKTQIKQRGLNSITNYAPLPIVFHVLHTGEAQGVGANVSQALIQAQVIQLNKDFANLSGSPYSVASNTGISFCLAQKSPSGAVLAQPGIDRINTTGKSYGTAPYLIDDFETNVKPATIWDPSRYINIWLTEFDASEGILGYSTFPASSTLDGLDESETDNTAGVAIDYNTLGSAGTPSSTCNSGNNYANGKTLTHELGHYFGLRHIWGDAACGDDYCDDTPIHADANYGAPTHPKPNSCGTADEMFENFMDYTDDIVLNTFTLNQAERIQAVMQNSLRRKQLPTSNAGCGNSTTGANKIGFYPCTGQLSVNEKSTMTTCPQYTDYKLYLSIEDKATGAATLNFSATGTATEGIDYDIIGKTTTIVTGDPYKQVTIRVYDDGSKEDDETVIITYKITGTGVVVNNQLPQVFTLTIQDNDHITIGQNTVTLINEDFGTSGNALPSGWKGVETSKYPSPRNRWVVGNKADIGTNGQSLYISNSSIIRNYDYSGNIASGHIVRTKLIDATAFSTLNLSFKYKVAGETDNDGTYDFGLVQTSPELEENSLSSVPGVPVLVGKYNSTVDTTDKVTGTINTSLPENVTGTKFYLNFYWENDDNFKSRPPLAIDDVVLTGKGTTVDSTLNHSNTLNIFPADSNFILNANSGSIIATISNASTLIRCLNANVQQAGTGLIDLNTNTGSYKRSQKVIKLTPASTSTATYTLTLYYTAAELANWPAITNLKVMKVKDGVALNSVLNAENAVLLTPVVRDLRNTSGYASFTVTTSGFSQFFLVSANTTLPVQLLSFNAAPLNNGASLTWTTANEVANKGFNVQRGIDGSNFDNIGFVAGKNQAATTNYSFYDEKLIAGIVYYYRLQQVDVNGKVSLSAVRTVKLNGNAIKILAYPNPAKEFTRVTTGTNMLATVSLFAANGTKVWEMPKQNISAAGFNVPLQNLPAGVYMLWITDDKTRTNIKIVKK